MLSPLWATFSGEMERIAGALQLTTLHFCPFATLPIDTRPTTLQVLEKLRFGGLELLKVVRRETRLLDHIAAREKKRG
jgi:hypothetical protein